MSHRQGRAARGDEKIPRGRRADLDGAVRSLHRIFKAVDTFSRRALRDFGVSGPQIWALRTIGSAGTMTAGELAARMHLHPSTVTGILQRLEDRHLVARSREAHDRRVLRLELTERGRALTYLAPEPPRSVVFRGLARLSRAHLAETRRSLDRVERFMRSGGFPEGTE
jgi:DNA-binding MarR family transcriptional regulator